MATPNAVKEAVKDTPKLATVFDFMKAKRDLIAQALPSTITPDRLIAIFTMLFNGSPKLMECTQVSLVAAVIQTVQLGLVPGPMGQVYYVPFNNKQQNGTWAKEVQFIIGYRGLCELVNRSGNASILNSECVYANDVFEYEQGLNPKLRHIPHQGERGKFIGVYCIAKNMLAGEKVFNFLQAEEVEKIRKASKAADSPYSPWVTWFEEMAKKSSVKRIQKLLPLSIEVQRQISADETVKHQISKNIIDVPDETNWEAQAPPEAEAKPEVPPMPEPADDKKVAFDYKPWEEVKKTLGEKRYFQILGAAGWEKKYQGEDR